MLDSRTYENTKTRQDQEKVKRKGEEGEGEEEEGDGYETSDDESCDLENGDFDTMSSCRSRSRSCCSVTTVANDDFEYFQRKGTKVTFLFSRQKTSSLFPSFVRSWKKRESIDRERDAKWLENNGELVGLAFVDCVNRES